MLELKYEAWRDLQSPRLLGAIERLSHRTERWPSLICLFICLPCGNYVKRSNRAKGQLRGLPLLRFFFLGKWGRMGVLPKVENQEKEQACRGKAMGPVWAVGAQQRGLDCSVALLSPSHLSPCERARGSQSQGLLCCPWNNPFSFLSITFRETAANELLKTHRE